MTRNASRGKGKRATTACASAVICLLGVFTTGASAAKTVIPSGATAISAGGAPGVGSHDCAVIVGGTAGCWGGHGSGQLGDGTTADSMVPVAPVGLGDVVAIGAGGGYSCAMSSAGMLELGQATSRFKTVGLFRLGKRLRPVGMRKVRAARLLKLRFKIPGAPGACARYYPKRLTIPKRISRQTVWFQSDSIFGVGWGS